MLLTQFLMPFSISNVNYWEFFGRGFTFEPNNKILDWSKLEACADDNINKTENMKFVMGKVENIVGEGENAGYQHFFLFPQCFQKSSLIRWLKVVIVWVKSHETNIISVFHCNNIRCKKLFGSDRKTHQ